MKVLKIVTTFVLILTTIADASVTWRRVTKPNTTTTSEKPLEVLTTPKSSVIWKRSTLSRRSTPDVSAEESSLDADDSDFEEADPKEELFTPEEDDKEEPSIMPLVPGSRPGFWFDSARRRKPSALLRPGSRRNSLFPSKATAAPTSTPESVTTVIPIIPFTLPTQENTTAKKDSTEGFKKLFGRNRSTKPPISFRRRPKTTKIPNTSFTTVSEKTIEKSTPTKNPEMITVGDDEIPLNKESGLTKRNRERNSSKPSRSPHKSLGLGTRRRMKNGTRLSWTKKSDNMEPNTTSTPQQLSTASTSSSPSTKDYDRFSRKPTSFPRSKSRTKSNKTTSSQDLWSRNKQKTNITNVSTTESYNTNEPKKSWTTRNYVNRNIHKFNRIATNSTTEAVDMLDASNVKAKSEIVQQNSLPPKKIYARTTVEPFYITRDYGRLVLAVPDLKDVKEKLPLSNTNTFNVSTTKKMETTTTTEDLKFTTHDETSNDHLEFNKVPFMTTTMKSPPTHENLEYHDEKIFQEVTKSTTAKPIIRPLTVPPTVDLGNNAYIVWSVSQGGSGWTFEKHGDQVKWSAQNSAAEGDRWSVTRKDVETTKESPLWEPLRNINQAQFVRLNEALPKPLNEFKEYFKDVKSDINNRMEKTSFIPSVSHRNETLLNVKIAAEPFVAAPQSDILAFPQFPVGKIDFSPNISTDILPKTVPSKEFLRIYDSSLSNSEILEADKVRYPGTNHTIQNIIEKELNEQIFRIPNENSSHVSFNIPYVAEIRQTLSDVPLTVAPNKSNAQNYATEIPEISEEKTTSITTYPQLGEYRIMKGGAQNIPPTIQPYTHVIESSSQKSDDEREFGIEVLEPYVDNQGVDQRIKDLSGFPPSLAKAVAESKRWTVVDSSVDDGWSLLGENGELEWKIHNIDGKWRITSADRFKINPPELTEYYTTSPESEQKKTENYESKQVFNQNIPKVWTLEDDYEKWKAISSEKGEPVDDSSDERTFNQAYEYDQNPELLNDYYSDDYLTSEPIVEQIETYPTDDFDGRPLWGTGGIEMVKRYPEGNNRRYENAVKFANTEEDAIAAWKSLLDEQGKWQLANREVKIGQISKPTVFHSKYNSSQGSPLAKDWKISPHDASDYQNEDQKKEFNSLSLNPINSQDVKMKEDGYNYENFQDESMETKHGSFAQELVQNENEQKHTDRHQRLQHQNAPQKKHPDHPKIDSLINKLEMIEKNAKGKAVVDLAKLLKLIKANRNSSENGAQMEESMHIKKNPKERYTQTENIEVIGEDYQNSASTLESKSKELETDQPSTYYSNFKLSNFNGKIQDPRKLKSIIEEKRFNSSEIETLQPRLLTRYRIVNTKNNSNRNNGLKPASKIPYKIPSEITEKQYIAPQNIKQRTSKPNHNLQTYTDQKIHQGYQNAKRLSQQVQYQDGLQQAKYTEATSASPRQFKTISTTRTLDEYPTSSEELVNYRDKSQISYKNSELTPNNGIKHSHRPNKKRPRRPHNSSPIILSGETEIEDEEDGSKKNRKIIVIDYAGKQKKKTSVDRKDLELIIRNVKHRRSELLENNINENGKNHSFDLL